jgi:hypothetical protein
MSGVYHSVKVTTTKTVKLSENAIGLGMDEIVGEEDDLSLDEVSHVQ